MLGAATDGLAGSWPALAASLLATSLLFALNPTTWRRPVREEFALALEFATLGSLQAVLTAAFVVGVGLVAQAFFWLQGLGETDTVRTTLILILMREIGPLTVGLVMLGRSGLVQLDELRRLRADGTIRVLEAQGIDPCLLLAMPRILAFAIATFAHALVFVFATLIVGYLAGGLITGRFVSLTTFALTTLGEIGASAVVVLPVKSLLLGLVLGAVVSATALAPWRGNPRLLVAQGFFRGLIALVIVSGTVSLML
jgi:phospholipid/cholesterol/gamma-HCH transport system permease protein